MRKILRRIVLIVVSGVPAALLCLFAGIWLEHLLPLELPRPSGPFGVGRIVESWIDSTHMDSLAPAPGVRRELLVWVWYPAPPRGAGTTSEYVPTALRRKDEPMDAGNIWTWLTKDPYRVRAHGIPGSALATGPRPLPVTVLRAGASAPVRNYTALAEDLASHGYVVVGFDAPYRTGRVVFPDGRVIGRTDANNPERCVVADRTTMERCVARVMTAWSDDIGFVLDRLAQLNASATGLFSGRLDPTHVGVWGHSLGGAIAAQFCRDDRRCAAGIDIDGAPHGSVVELGLERPFMFLLSDHRREADPVSAGIVAEIKSVYDHTPPDRRVWAEIRGAFHFTFSDDGAFLKSHLVRAIIRVLGRLDMSGRRQVEVTAYAIRTFLDTHLKGVGGQPLASAEYPELEVK